jgi:hypothetical protein
MKYKIISSKKQFKKNELSKILIIKASNYAKKEEAMQTKIYL